MRAFIAGQPHSCKTTQQGNTPALAAALTLRQAGGEGDIALGMQQPLQRLLPAVGIAACAAPASAGRGASGAVGGVQSARGCRCSAA